MLKLERSPSHSWWWNSHNSPKHSKWLQSNLQELDEKVKEMLRLIEEDADSFAQRAEMYYQKRPELVNLVEEFYRAYRSLAERYDHLTGEIRQNIPRALQVQYGLSCDSPKSMGVTGGQHCYSPLRKSNQVFESLLRKAGQGEDKMDDIHAVDQIQTPARMNIKQNGFDHSCIEQLSENRHYYDASVEFLTKEKDLSPEGGIKSSSSDSEAEHFTPVEKLQQEIRNLETENRLLAESHRKVLELNTALQRRVETLEDQCKSVQSEADLVKGEVDRLNEDLHLLQGARAISMEDNDLSATGKEMQGGNDAQQSPDLCVDDHDIACCLGEDANLAEDYGCDNELANYADVAECENQDYLVKLGSLHQPFAGRVRKKMMGLMEENRKHKLAILERGEEKREAIRQLCFSMDTLKLENQRLVIILVSMKKRLNALSTGTTSTAAVAPLQVLPAWKKVLCLGD